MMTIVCLGRPILDKIINENDLADKMPENIPAEKLLADLSISELIKVRKGNTD